MLYAITDSNLLNDDKLFSGVEATLNAGCDWIQYRDKSQDQAKRLKEASQLLKICNRYSASLMINDDLLLAKKINAHGVHLGQGDGDVKVARKLLGKDSIIGVTCHNSLDLAQKAIDDGASYIAFGRFFSSNTKPDAQGASLDLLVAARKNFSHIKIVAIGGITPENAKMILDAGANKIAVCHGLFSADNIEAQTKRFIKN
ncbi:MAG: thiamine phosphate synthase [Cellvibrio sp.]|nr:thiamine phosphate synthase [Cellvibrio sp.]